MIVTVTTDDGTIVNAWTDVTYADVILARVVVPNRRGSSFYAGLHRAMRDAEEIEAGRDPERPSEKAMRLAAETPYSVSEPMDGVNG